MSAAAVIDLSTRRIKIYASAYDAQARADLEAHSADVDNPHSVTAAQVGLGNVDNTSDAAKPLSDAAVAALALKAPFASPALTGTPSAPTAPLGTVTTQVATTEFVQAAINAVDIPDVTNDLAQHLADTANPHVVTKSQVGLGNADNTADATKPVSAAQQAAINAAAGLANAAQADIDGHQANIANPHGTTKAQVGLGNADNTADVNKPVSSAQQIAINAVAATAAAAQADIDGHQSNVSNPHGVTKAQVGLGNADNTADLAKPVSTATQAAINVVGASAAAAQADIDGHQANTANPHGVTKGQVGLGNADNTSDLNKPVSTATQAALNPITANLASHTGNLANPHGVTKAQVGLGAVDNTSDAAKPISTATQTAIDAANDNLTAHTGNVSNPHGVTKAQIGLGNVDDTSDAGKPVSTATAAALALKAPLVSPALTGTPTAPTAVAGTATTQIATTAFATAAASATEVASRPGDAVALYCETKIGPSEATTPIDPAWVVASAAGNVVRVNSATADDPQTVAPEAAYPIESGRVYEARWRVARQTNPADPLNDSVTLGLQWLTNTKANNGQTIVDDIPLTVINGVQQRVARIGAAPLAAILPPAGTVYCRPFVDMYGETHVTDVITIDISDVTGIVQSLGVNVATPASGDLITLNDLRPVLIGNTGPLAALTIRLPGAPGPGGLIELGFLGVVAALVVADSAGAPITTAPTSAYGPGAALVFRYIDATLGWVYWK